MYSPAKEWVEYLESFPEPSALYLHGDLPPTLAFELREAILGSKVVRIDNRVDPSAVAAKLSDKDIEILNEQHRYRELDERTKIAIWRVLAFLKTSVTAFLRSPWRVLTVRSWTTAGGGDYGPTAWHTDGDLAKLLKIMVYTNGGIELPEEVVRGDKWIVFYNSLVRHRGVAGGQIRTATEITISPSREYDLRPFTLGLVARHAILP